MSEYVEPTQEQFNDAETVVLDVMNVKCPSAMDKMGSAVRELVVRPMAYLFSWIERNVDNYRQESSVAYLKTSTATENPIADMVASNYFVTRRQGTQAKGLMGLVVSAPFVRIPSGARMLVADVPVVTPYQIVLTTGAPTSTVPGVEYIKLSNWTPGDDGTARYIGYIPIVAEEAGNIEVPAGVDVEIQFSTAFVESAELVSPVSGGSDVETDAEMMARCEYSTASGGVGSYYGLRKKMDSAPIHVPGMAIVAGDDDYMYRARYNSVNINPGGYVDCYIKTRDQEDVIELGPDQGVVVDGPEPATNVNAPDNATSYYNWTAHVPAAACPGFYAVLGVRYTYGDSENPNSGSPSSFSVAFTGDRLSAGQRADITFQSELSTITGVYITVSYMGGIDTIQAYMDREDNTFIGQDVEIKAAVPVSLGMACAVSSASELTPTQIALLQDTITSYINALPVGTAAVNFSDIRKLCAAALPEADLRLPCTFTAKCYTESGLVDSWNSTTGILNIAHPGNIDCFSYRVSFFSITPTSISIEQI